MRSPCPSCNSSSAYQQGDFGYCHKCGYLSESKRTAGLFSGIAKDSTEIKLPDDMVFYPNKFHPDALRWLYDYYMTDKLIVENLIAYIPVQHKIMIPNLAEGKLHYYILRALCKKDSLRYKAVGQKNSALFIRQKAKSSTIVIVEDQISCIRVGEQFDSLALLGTSMRIDRIAHLLPLYESIVFWTDNDDGGYLAKHKLVNSIRDYSEHYNERLLFTNSKEFLNLDFFEVNQRDIDLDPKCYSNSDIKYILCNEIKEL